MNWLTAAALLAGISLGSPVLAQSTNTFVVAGPAAIQQEPRGDGVTLGVVAPGTVVEILDRFETWYLVTAPASNAGEVSMQRGWINIEMLQLPNGRMANARGSQFLVRGFGQAGGLLFSAKDSFDALVGSTVNTVYGAGGQMVLPNGVFGQVGVERFQKTGTRALVSGNQVFTLDIPNRLTVTAVQATAGYRVEGSNRISTYFGGGLGWHTLEEASPSVPGVEPASKRNLGYHILGGVEYPLMGWFWIGGEAQWATVPKALGESGLSAVYEEKDLGGVTFRLKLIVGY
jgi:opacity protein-like surface antigen